MAPKNPQRQIPAPRVAHNIRDAIRAHVAQLSNRIQRNRHGQTAEAIIGAFPDSADLQQYLALGAKLAAVVPAVKAPVAAVAPAPAAPVAPVAPVASVAAAVGTSGQAAS
jgi:hypothetical protein